jgi:hypothetical protein
MPQIIDRHDEHVRRDVDRAHQRFWLLGSRVAAHLLAEIPVKMAAGRTSSAFSTAHASMRTRSASSASPTGRRYHYGRYRERGLLVKCWAGCDARDVLAELRRRGLLGGRTEPDARPALARHSGNNRDNVVRRFAAARSIWNAAKEAQGSPVADLPVPPTLRWAPSLRRLDGTHGPAMVARINSLDGELIGISRTWLDSGPDVGERAARIAARHWLAEGRRVRLALPPEPGSDFNDLLNVKEARHAAA